MPRSSPAWYDAGMEPLTWIHNDGGRTAAGYHGTAGDCVTRAIAIVTDLNYQTVYDELAQRAAQNGGPRSARNGIPASIYRPFLAELGFVWHPKMSIGSGCTHHLRPGEVPSTGSHIIRLTKHLVALVDGILHDTHDPSRGGTRCVYGWWTWDRV